MTTRNPRVLAPVLVTLLGAAAGFVAAYFSFRSATTDRPVGEPATEQMLALGFGVACLVLLVVGRAWRRRLSAGGRHQPGPRSAFSPPPPPPEERPDSVSQRIDALSREKVRHSLDASVRHIVVASVLGLLVPVVIGPVAIATKFVAGRDASGTGGLAWTLAFVAACVLTAAAGALGLGLPRRRTHGDHGRYRSATGAMAALTAGCVALIALLLGGLASRGWPVALDLTNALFAGATVLLLLTLMLTARALRAGTALARLAGESALSFADPLPPAIGSRAAEQRRRAVARAAESTLAGHDLLTECRGRTRGVVVLVLLVLGGVGASAGLSMVADGIPSYLALGQAGLTALLGLLALVTALAAAWLRPHRAGSLVPATAGLLSAAAATHLGWLASSAPTVPGVVPLAVLAGHVAVAVVVAVSAARLHPVRRYDGAVPSLPALVDALRSNEPHVRQPAHQLLIRMAEVDLAPDVTEWRKWMEAELDARGRLPVEA